MDFTIIEILNNDDIDDFFYLDDNIFKKKYSNDIYFDNKVIIYGINSNGKPGFSNGKIKKIQDYSFAYNCNTYPGCSGGCVVNQINNCVIGIHRGEIKTKNEKAINAGVFIWNAINYIKNKKEQEQKELKKISPLNIYSKEKIIAFKRLKEEYLSLNKDQTLSINIGFSLILPDENNIFEWIFTLMGPKDSSYSGGLFYLKAYFPDDYPIRAPDVCYITPIYHINVNHKAKFFDRAERLGHISITTLNWWKSDITMKEIILSIFCLFYLGNPDSPYGLDRADEMRYNRKLFEEKIKYFTKKYAKSSIGYKEYEKCEKSWDFTYP